MVTTSRARTTLRTFRGSIRAAASGSSRASWAWRASGPSFAARLSSRRLRSGSSVGAACSGASAARMYSPVPPDNKAQPLSLRSSSMSGRARAAYSTAEQLAVGSSVPTSSCGASRLSFSEGWLVSSGRPPYICIESQEMTRTPSRRDRAMATAVFPTPVGPNRAMT